MDNNAPYAYGWSSGYVELRREMIETISKQDRLYLASLTALGVAIAIIDAGATRGTLAQPIWFTYMFAVLVLQAKMLHYRDTIHRIGSYLAAMEDCECKAMRLPTYQWETDFSAFKKKRDESRYGLVGFSEEAIPIDEDGPSQGITDESGSSVGEKRLEELGRCKACEYSFSNAIAGCLVWLIEKLIHFIRGAAFFVLEAMGLYLLCNAATPDSPNSIWFAGGVVALVICVSFTSYGMRDRWKHSKYTNIWRQVVYEKRASLVGAMILH